MENVSCDYATKFNLKRIMRTKMQEIGMRKAYIWGTGSMARKVYNMLSSIGITINGFIDSNESKDGTVFLKKTVHNPSQIQNRSLDIYVFIASIYANEIESQLLAMGYTTSDFCSKYEQALKTAWVSVTGRCNLKCSFCYSPLTGDITEDMSFQQFKEIVDELFVNGYNLLSFVGIGENMLNKDFHAMLEYACSKMDCVELTTNAVNLNTGLIESIIKNKVLSITFSVTGFSDETYLTFQGFKTNNPMLKDVVYRNIQNFIDTNKKYGNQVSTQLSYLLTDENVDDFNNYVKFWENKVDAIIIENLLNVPREKNYAFNEVAYPLNTEKKLCPLIGKSIFIDRDGDASICCVDFHKHFVIGNVFRNSMADILQSEDYKKAVIANTVSDFAMLPEMCWDCYVMCDNEFTNHIAYEDLKEAISSVFRFKQLGFTRIAFWGVNLHLTKFIRALQITKEYDKLEFIVVDTDKVGIYERKKIKKPSLELFKERQVFVFGNGSELERTKGIIKFMDIDDIFWNI